jgi:hypothetical protein
MLDFIIGLLFSFAWALVGYTIGCLYPTTMRTDNQIFIFIIIALLAIINTLFLMVNGDEK